jgi:hypothetical protein
MLTHRQWISQLGEVIAATKPSNRGKKGDVHVYVSDLSSHMSQWFGDVAVVTFGAAVPRFQARIVREVTPAVRQAISAQLHTNGQGNVDDIIKAVSDSIEKKAKMITDKDGDMKRLAATPVVQGLAQVHVLDSVRSIS